MIYINELRKTHPNTARIARMMEEDSGATELMIQENILMIHPTRIQDLEDRLGTIRSESDLEILACGTEEEIEELMVRIPELRPTNRVLEAMFDFNIDRHHDLQAGN